MALEPLIRLEHPDLYMPDGMTGYVEFYLPEVEDLTAKPATESDIQRAQLGNITVYEKYTAHYLFDITFRIATRDTYDKLDSLYHIKPYDERSWEEQQLNPRPLSDAFWLRPYMLVYPLERFYVVWMNRDDWGEKWWRGYMSADEPVKCQFQESLGAPCYPPS